MHTERRWLAFLQRYVSRRRLVIAVVRQRMGRVIGVAV